MITTGPPAVLDVGIGTCGQLAVGKAALRVRRDG